jgi:orotate phosphoribosyltransferase
MERAVRFGEFTLASGRTSDFYVDIKKIFLDPEALELLGHCMVRRWYEVGGPIGAVGGMTLGADPLIASFVLAARSSGRSVPGFIVRKQPKSHGTQQFLEGAADLARGTEVLLLEDVVTSGGSSIKTAHRCIEHGFVPRAVLTVVDREEGGSAAIEAEGLGFYALFSRTDLKDAIERPGR